MRFGLQSIATLAFVTLMSPVLSKPVDSEVAQNAQVASKEISEKWFTNHFGTGSLSYNYYANLGGCFANGLQIVNFNNVNCVFSDYNTCIPVTGGCPGVVYPNVNDYLKYLVNPYQTINGWRIYRGPGSLGFYQGYNTFGVFPWSSVGSFSNYITTVRQPFW
ncbi:uncharacterized protein MELLADRAFT_123659 [Melampsora larici-populina 98AG31]|uniref:Secreted protein n=1 Tax=Melampsora larici-populina (strain 98AG31 / pathotype 3-4-7) TaxID=747676 RepID=F4RG54_MELLP|nr:uncharacterized protein MELLADRAFT_123659 [Melampsora larici-populina 98AG31]EGG08550.1 secreted protein [Melampsora larici-populina 98AG31]